MSKPELTFAVTDLETTGLSPVDDFITEIAVMGCDAEYRELFRFHTAIAPTFESVERLLDQPYAAQMAEESGLMAELATATDLPTLAEAEAQLIDILSGYTPGENGRFVISGSGIGSHDIPFLRHHMPALVELTHYYPDDAGVLRRSWRRATGSDLVDANTHKTHRAMDDVLCHVDELRAFREALRKAGPRRLRATRSSPRRA